MQLLSVFSHDKKSFVSVSVETRNFEEKFFDHSFMKKNAYHTISQYEKNAYHTISFMEKMLILLFPYIYFYSKKLYERI